MSRLSIRRLLETEARLPELRGLLASRADAEDLQEVTVDGELRVAREIVHEIVDGAGGKGDGGPAPGAD